MIRLIKSKIIYKKSNDLIRQCGTGDVFQIAKELGIQFTYRFDFKKLLGMYLYQWRHRYVFLNQNMDEYLSRIVMAHEIGHDTKALQSMKQMRW